MEGFRHLRPKTLKTETLEPQALTRPKSGLTGWSEIWEGAVSGIRVRGTRPSFGLKGLLGGSWVLISRVLSGVTIPITHIRDL